MEYAIILSDNNIPYMIPMGYSYWCSHLNRMIHITQSSDHFLYSVALNTEGQMISHLYTRDPFESARLFTHNNLTLSHFHGLFNDYIQPNIFTDYHHS